MRAIFRLAAPSIATSMLQASMAVTDQVYVGHLGNDELAAAAIGNTWFNMQWFFCVGVATALDT
eukprot:CAMPEP_0196795034 /NCGR_PEP_ID=MMETSP1104-20130614/35352_1 /TAXON_ID=33652 /ORGANISM="Cafeteria sp., Strain Caron Lab Isolate" /LENGTH=63 /DNA_ID=CAMNT_0042165423 /DNA_START=1 /DNA_END=188 /DNA_ORIENTATION=+